MTNAVAIEDAIPNLLTLKQLETYYGFSPATIMRERWELKQVIQNTKKAKELKINSSGFGFSVPAVHNGRKIMYSKKEVEKWIDRNTEDLSPEERVNKIA